MTASTSHDHRTISREDLMTMTAAPEPIRDDEIAALRRLLHIAHSDTGQSRKCADFLLAWWNAGNAGGWDLTDLWGVDKALADDMLTVLALIARLQHYPDHYGLREDFVSLIGQWRPQLASHDRDD